MAGRRSEGIGEAGGLLAVRWYSWRKPGRSDFVQAFEQRAQLRRQLFERRKMRRQRLRDGAANNLFQFGAVRQIVQLGLVSHSIIVLRHGVEVPIASY
jgi:hypothetical protein